MKISTLIINHVDLELLEQQRLALAEISSEDKKQLPVAAACAIEGIQNMLDTWSDEALLSINSPYRGG